MTRWLILPRVVDRPGVEGGVNVIIHLSVEDRRQNQSDPFPAAMVARSPAGELGFKNVLIFYSGNPPMKERLQQDLSSYYTVEKREDVIRSE